MKNPEALLRNLERREVEELSLTSGRVPRVRVAGELDPLHSEAPSADEILSILMTVGGSRYVESLGPVPKQWTARLPGVGVVAITAVIPRAGEVQARFTLAAREERARPPTSPRSATTGGDRPPTLSGARRGSVRPPSPQPTPAARHTTEPDRYEEPGSQHPILGTKRRPISDRPPPTTAPAMRRPVESPPPAAVDKRRPSDRPPPMASPSARRPVDSPPPLGGRVPAAMDGWHLSERPPTSPPARRPGTGDPPDGRRPVTGDPPTGRRPVTGDPPDGRRPVTGDPPGVPVRRPGTGDPPGGLAQRPATGDPPGGGARGAGASAQEAPTRPIRTPAFGVTMLRDEPGAAPSPPSGSNKSVPRTPTPELGFPPPPARGGTPSSSPSLDGTERPGATRSGKVTPAPRVDVTSAAKVDAVANTEAPAKWSVKSAWGQTPGEGIRELEPLLKTARTAGATDLHVVAGRPLLLRVAGELLPKGDRLEVRVIEKLLLGCIPERLRGTFEELGSCDFSLELPSLGRFRVNVSRQQTGLKATIRLIPRDVPTLEMLGLPPAIGAATKHHQGLIVVTGPTGHGKTSTLAAIVDILNQTTTSHIITVEDPVEYVHPRKRALISQREVGLHTRSFASALKGSLREDPDVIVVGEMRDTETVRMAVAASETGHLVIGTMNTPSASKTIDRLIDLFPPADQPQVRTSLASGLRLIVGQRLVPSADGSRMYAAAELLSGSVPLSALIREGKTFQIPSLQQRGKALGIIRLDDSLAALVQGRHVTLEMAKSFAESPHELESLVAQRRG